MVICLSRSFCSTDQEEREIAHSLGLSKMVMYQHFRRGSKAGGNKAKEMKYLSLNLNVISFVLFTSARELSMNFDNSN